MSAKRDFICRLCLKVPRNSFLLIDETVRKMLEILFLKMDLDVTDNPLMCGDCAVIVKKLVSFKLVYSNSEKMITSFCTGKNIANVDIRDMSAHNSTEIIDGHTEICRFCIKEVERSSFSLSEIIKQNTSSCILKMYMCELDLKIIKNPLICLNCRDNMESYFKFLLNCRDTEDKINAYRQHNILTDEKIMLIDVFETFSKRKKEEQNCNWAMEIKEEFDTEIDPLLYSYGEINNHEPCTCDIKDNSHCLRCLSLSTDVVLTTELIKVETLPSEVSSNQKLAIETEELIIKDEVTLGVSEQKNLENRLKAQHFECDKCDFKTKHGSSLWNHLLKHKDSSEVQMYQCENCEYQTKLKGNLKYHMLVHQGSSEVQMYQCDSCEYQAKLKGNLKRHMLVHQGSSEVQMYQCDSCEYQTKRKHTLKKHILVHKDCSEVELYQCERCGYQAKRKDALKKHIMSHKDSSEVQMYQCDNCEFKTKYKYSINRHILTHKDVAS